MKKFTFVLLAALWGGISVNADESLCLHFAGHWDDNSYTFDNKGTNGSGETIWEYTLNSTSNPILSSGDFYFRITYTNWDNDLGPNNGNINNNND